MDETILDQTEIPRFENDFTISTIQKKDLTYMNQGDS